MRMEISNKLRTPCHPLQCCHRHLVHLQVIAHSARAHFLLHNASL